MSTESFDPYHKWLGISPKDQPPNHYRLLGVELFEPDQEAIDHAADQRLRHVRALQNGPHAHVAQQLLNQLALARVVLLDPAQRRVYDEALARQMTLAAPPVAVSTPEAVGVGPSPRKAKPPRRKNLPWEVVKVILGALAAIPLSFLLLSYLRPDWDHFRIFRHAEVEQARHDPPPREREERPLAPVEPVEPIDQKREVPPSAPVDPATDNETEPDKPAVVAETPRVEAPPVQPAGKLPPPDAAAEQAALIAVADLLADTDPAQLESAARTREGAERFVLLAAARDLAAAAGDCLTASRLDDALAAAFEVDPFAQRTATLEKLRAGCVTPEQNRLLANLILLHFERAQAQAQHDALVPLAEMALAAARQAGSADLERQATLKLLAARSSRP